LGPCPPCDIRVRAILRVCYIRVSPLYPVNGRHTTPESCKRLPKVHSLFSRVETTRTGGLNAGLYLTTEGTRVQVIYLLSIYLSIYLFIYMSIYLSIYIYIYLSIYVYLSIFLSIHTATPSNTLAWLVCQISPVLDHIPPIWPIVCACQHGRLFVQYGRSSVLE